jgi:hypothetical protein
MLMRLLDGGGVLSSRTAPDRSYGLSSIAALKGSSRPVKPVERSEAHHWQRLLEL